MTIERNRYFTGQLLDEADLTQEQDYLREKARRHNRMLHGWGVADGLDVQPGPGAGKLTVEAGYALDPYGNEIVVEEAAIVDIGSEDTDGNAVSPCPPPDDHGAKRVRKKRPPGRPLYLAIRYAECATRPVPAGESVEFSRTRESFALKLLTKLPASYRNRPRADPWVVLAEIVLDADSNVSSVDCRATDGALAASGRAG